MAGEIITAPSPMDSTKLSDARRQALTEMLHQVRVFSRRADRPEDRIAFAELEHELLETQKRWERSGLINGQEELPLAAEASDGR